MGVRREVDGFARMIVDCRGYICVSLGSVDDVSKALDTNQEGPLPNAVGGSRFVTASSTRGLDVSEC